MIGVLASAEAVIWLSILVKTLAYAATLVAAGSVFVSVGLRALSRDGRVALHRTAAFSALASAFLSILRLPVRASFLMGGSIEGAIDPTMLDLVAESPLGESILLRLIGLTLILLILFPRRGSKALAVTGALMACSSFAFRGHAIGEPRLLLGVLVTLHITGLAFWLGAFAPLLRATRNETAQQAGALAHEFGAKALWAVATLIVAGAFTLALLGAATPAALATPYGQAFLVKLLLFAGVLGFAALNKVRLSPALQAGIPGAAHRLRRSIGLESLLVLAILATTAALTTVASPPAEEARLMPLRPDAVQTAARSPTEARWDT